MKNEENVLFKRHGNLVKRRCIYYIVALDSLSIYELLVAVAKPTPSQLYN